MTVAVYLNHMTIVRPRRIRKRPGEWWKSTGLERCNEEPPVKSSKRHTHLSAERGRRIMSDKDSSEDSSSNEASVIKSRTDPEIVYDDKGDVT